MPLALQLLRVAIIGRGVAFFFVFMQAHLLSLRSRIAVCTFRRPTGACLATAANRRASGLARQQFLLLRVLMAGASFRCPEKRRPRSPVPRGEIESWLQSGVLAGEFRRSNPSTAASTFPGISDEWYSEAAYSLTAAGPLRSCTGFPVVLGGQPEAKVEFRLQCRNDLPATLGCRSHPDVHCGLC